MARRPNQPEVNDEGGVAHVWTGSVSPACAVTLKNKASFADLDRQGAHQVVREDVWLPRDSGRS
jgi:hypothetical protein